MFGLSGSKSKSRSTGESQSTSFSFGDSFSLQGSQSGSVSGGSSTARAANESASTSRQGLAFEDVFARLYGSAEQTAASLDPSLLTQASNQLFSGGTDFLAGLGGDAGSAFLENRLAQGDQLTGEQIALLQQDIGQLFREELMPGITSDAVAGGQLGGGRQGVAQGQAMEQAANAFQRGAVDIRSRNQAQLDALAAGVAERNIQGAQVGLAGAGSLMNIAQQGFGAELAPMERLAAIFGGPTVLTQQDSAASGYSMSDALDFARAFSESFGRSESTERAGSQSTSKTSSTSKSGSFGLGF